MLLYIILKGTKLFTTDSGRARKDVQSFIELWRDPSAFDDTLLEYRWTLVKARRHAFEKIYIGTRIDIYPMHVFSLLEEEDEGGKNSV